MMGQKTYQEKIFYSFSLSQKVPADHLLRKVAAVVNVGFVRDMVSSHYSHTGQPSIAPEVLFKMMLIGYLYGITSERRLAEDISLNMAFMWYLGYDVDEATPHHSVISKARHRYGPGVFEEFFKRILGRCVEAGLVGGEKIYADSTIIRANASLQSVKPRPEAVEPRYGVKEFVGRVFSENPIEESSENGAGPGGGSGRLSNKTHVSSTDPEASLLSHGMKLPLQLCYKEHLTVDSRARVITAVVTTAGAVGDDTQLKPLLDRQPVEVKAVGADRKYGTFDNYRLLMERGIRAGISPWEPGPPTRNHFLQKRFVYEAMGDVYRCPQGKVLKRGDYRPEARRWTYMARKKDCGACPVRAQCIGPTLQKRRVFRHEHQGAKDWAMGYLKTADGRRMLKERSVYVEWANAESKNCHGLRRAKQRGLRNVSIQVLMTASVQNIKRLLKEFGKRKAALATKIKNALGNPATIFPPPVFLH